MTTAADDDELRAIVRTIVREEVRAGLHRYVLSTIADIGAEASPDVAAQVAILRGYGALPPSFRAELAADLANFEYPRRIGLWTGLPSDDGRGGNGDDAAQNE